MRGRRPSIGQPSGFYGTPLANEECLSTEVPSRRKRKREFQEIISNVAIGDGSHINEPHEGTSGHLDVGYVSFSSARTTHGNANNPWNIPLLPYNLPPCNSCVHCAAKRFKFETAGFCCSDGSVTLVSLNAPQPLWDLFTSQTEISAEFKPRVRTYNNNLAFTSFGVTYDRELCKNKGGVYTFKAQGQCYHFFKSLVPLDNKPSNLQLYFYDTEHELENRLRFSDGLNPAILSKLMSIVSENPYTRFFRTLKDIPDLNECRIVIRDHVKLDQRVFNAPTASQVAAIWVDSDNNVSSRDIVVYGNPGTTYNVKHFYGCYDSVQYPLLFPYGEPGWHEGILRRNYSDDSQTSNQVLEPIDIAASAEELINLESQALEEGRRKRNTISCREYYAFKLQIRPGDRSVLLHSGRLFQQYVVDMYIKLETSRLDFFTLNQVAIRAELYNGIADCIAAGETNPANIGHKYILPASFIGGPRDMRKRYLDAMALVLRFGKPDIFLTMTCNPAWPEITTELLPGEKAQDRPDLIARVFRGKLEELKCDLFKRQIFGPVAAYVYVIEFQKRGLPHAHFLIILKTHAKIRTADMFDKFVSAEIPPKGVNPHLHHAVWKHMMHGPCGRMNPKNACMKRNNLCKNHYPKDYCEKTTLGNDSYPIYRRRNNKETVLVRGHILDNRWVVPYNPFLLAKYDCHLNVEICSTIKAVKYLYKYIYKGHDRVLFNVVTMDVQHSNNEIENYRSARWVSPPEAVWRIYRFVLNEVYPAVLQLQLHLENEHSLTFSSRANLRNLVESEASKKTMLTEYFYMNRTNPAARQVSYKKFPEYFVWNKGEKAWTPRKRGFCIGRIVSVGPLEGDRFYLRLLLLNVVGATSFNDLKWVNGVFYDTFREAALARGLLEADNSLEISLQEASTYQMPSTMRRLFAAILVYCNPSNAKGLWAKFSVYMHEDFDRLPGMTPIVAQKKALADICLQLESMGKNINDFNLVGFHISSDTHTRGFREIEDELKLPVPTEDLQNIDKLNNEQLFAYEKIIEYVRSNKPGAFFIDGPGGTGKSFLYCCLLATIRSEGSIALATASSGVAASILPGGRTAHSRFKIPLNMDESRSCSISKQSGLAKLIVASKLIIWDEAAMVKKIAVEAFDQMLQDICQSDELFGGKVVVFGGDFRQVLPIIPKATSEETIEGSLVKSKLWSSMEKIRLHHNMRAQLDPSYSDFVLRVGDGLEEVFDGNQIKIPSSIAIKDEGPASLKKLLDLAFPDLNAAFHNIDSIVNRAILAPKNDLVEEINDTLIQSFPGELTTYHSFDTAMDISQSGIHEEFYNTLTPSGYPPHLLKLKLNCPVILLRNIDPSKGLCNGTRLICKAFGKNLIYAEIATGNYKGQPVFLPRIPILSPDTETTPYPFKRTQFPIRLCFAMTINKAQGQTLDFVGVYLPQPVFSHGQLYVALSRVRNSASVRVLVTCGNADYNEGNTFTKNVVYHKVLHLANSS